MFDVGVGFCHRPSPFQFFNHWAEEDRFHAIVEVESPWNAHVGVSPIVGLMRNLRGLKGVLRHEFGATLAILSMPLWQPVLLWKDPKRT